MAHYNSKYLLFLPNNNNLINRENSNKIHTIFYYFDIFALT